MKSLLDLVQLTALMERTSGRQEVRIGLLEHPDLATGNIREVSSTAGATCSRPNSLACLHGTSVAGILSAKRESLAPAICPGCTLLVRPIFAETATGNGGAPSATSEQLAEAILETINFGARVINLSAALRLQHSTRGDQQLEEALNHASSRGVIVVAAAGNQGSLGSSIITAHPWVISVAACNSKGYPVNDSNLGSSIGMRGLLAPGENIRSLGTSREPGFFGGTSAAVPFVTGAIALLWSEFPTAQPNHIRLSVTSCRTSRRTSVVPPLLDAWTAYKMMTSLI